LKSSKKFQLQSIQIIQVLLNKIWSLIKNMILIFSKSVSKKKTRALFSGKQSISWTFSRKMMVSNWLFNFSKAETLSQHYNQNLRMKKMTHMNWCLLTFWAKYWQFFLIVVNSYNHNFLKNLWRLFKKLLIFVSLI
jgi:hypothetical protein